MEIGDCRRGALGCSRILSLERFRMLVLHGFWAAHDGLCLWAEDSGRPVSSGSQVARSARPHPFAAPASTLAAIHAGKPAEAVLLLPSQRTAPLDSPELVRITSRPDPRGKP